MTSPSPWSIKGIPPEARQRAKDAAKRSGKTLGEWMSEMIAEDADATAEPQAAEQKQAKPPERAPLKVTLRRPQPKADADAATAKKQAKPSAAVETATPTPTQPVAPQAAPAPAPAPAADAGLADALKGIAAVLGDFTARRDDRDDALEAAQSRAEAADKRVDSLTAEVSARLDAMTAQFDERHGAATETLGRQIDAAVERVDTLAGSMRDLAQSVEVTAKRGVATDTAIRRIAQSVHALDGAVATSRQRTEEALQKTLEQLERLAQRNEPAAEALVEQVFQDPRLPLMIRTVVREAFEDFTAAQPAAARAPKPQAEPAAAAEAPAETTQEVKLEAEATVEAKVEAAVEPEIAPAVEPAVEATVAAAPAPEAAVPSTEPTAAEPTAEPQTPKAEAVAPKAEAPKAAPQSFAFTAWTGGVAEGAFDQTGVSISVSLPAAAPAPASDAPTAEIAADEDEPLTLDMPLDEEAPAVSSVDAPAAAEAAERAPEPSHSEAPADEAMAAHDPFEAALAARAAEPSADFDADETTLEPESQAADAPEFEAAVDAAVALAETTAEAPAEKTNEDDVDAFLREAEAWAESRGAESIEIDDAFDAPTERWRSEGWRTDDDWRMLAEDEAPELAARVAKLDGDSQRQAGPNFGGDDGDEPIATGSLDALDAELDALMADALQERRGLDARPKPSAHARVASWDDAGDEGFDGWRRGVDALADEVGLKDMSPDIADDAASALAAAAASAEDAPRTRGRDQKSKAPSDAFDGASHAAAAAAIDGSVDVFDDILAARDEMIARRDAEALRALGEGDGENAARSSGFSDAFDDVFDVDAAARRMASDHRRTRRELDAFDASAEDLIADAARELGERPETDETSPQSDVQPAKSASEAMRRARESAAARRSSFDDEDEDDAQIPGFGALAGSVDDWATDAPAAAAAVERKTGGGETAVGAWRAARARGRAAETPAEPDGALKTGAETRETSRWRAQGRRQAVVSSDLDEGDDLLAGGAYDGDDATSGRLGVVLTLALLALAAGGAVLYLFWLGA